MMRPTPSSPLQAVPVDSNLDRGPPSILVAQTLTTHSTASVYLMVWPISSRCLPSRLALSAYSLPGRSRPPCQYADFARRNGPPDGRWGGLVLALLSKCYSMMRAMSDCGFTPDGIIQDRRTSPTIGPSTGCAAAGYVDNVLVVGTSPEDVNLRLGKVTKVLVTQGLLVHEEEAAFSKSESVGLSIDRGDRGIISITSIPPARRPRASP